MKKVSLLFFGLVGLVCLIGCGSNVQLNGTVTYEDGSPVEFGNVVFATDKFQASGMIKSEGKYTMGSVDVSDGLPKGSYKVYIEGASEEVSGRGGTSMRSLIDPKFTTFASTPLTCDIPAPKNTFDIKVPKNPK